jgi:hypothetical protein
MRKIVYAITLLCVAGLAKAQNDYKNIPEKAISRFMHLYPGVDPKELDWDKKCNYHEAEFKVNDHDITAYFDYKGAWISSKTEDLSLLDLPDPVKDQLYNSRYALWEADVIEKVEDEDKTVYILEVENNITRRYLYFYPNGIMTEKTEKEIDC